MVSVCLYFQVHQPYRIKDFSVFEIGKETEYFTTKLENDTNNKEVLLKVAKKCYLPANKILLELIKKYPEFKITFSFSGVLLDQLEEFAPNILESFKELVKTGNVEILQETYYHSLSFLYSRGEFREQIKKHREKIKEIFGVEPKVFRNTELIYNNELAQEIEDLGFLGIMAEGADQTLGWRSPNFLYRPSSTSNIKLLLKNYRLSDDIAFRFSKQDWDQWPLTAEKYAKWIDSINGSGEIINLFMDYETFGEHQWEDTGIFKFLKELPGEILKHPRNNFKTPSQIIKGKTSIATYDSKNFSSWADIERDLSAWVGNEMQRAAIKKVYELEHKIFLTKNKKIIEDWRKLQTSDHYYYMSTKWLSDGQVHGYFSPYESPYEAFISFMNIIQDLELRVEKMLEEKSPSQKLLLPNNIYK